MSPTTYLQNDRAAVDGSDTGLDLEDQREVERPDLPPPLVKPVVIPPHKRAEDDEEISPQRRRLLDHLLGMADMYADNGSLRQAIELFFELVSDHEGTDHALLAGDRLMAIAQVYKDHGELHMARGIYERLLKLS